MGMKKLKLLQHPVQFSLVNSLIHEGKDVGIQVFSGSKLTINQCEIKHHAETNVVVHESELVASDSRIAKSNGNGLYIGEKSKADIYDCQLSGHKKPQLFIENSKAEIRKCQVTNGSTTGITIFNEADVMMTECTIHHHTQFHVIVDASGLVLDQCIIQFGQTGGIYGNDHAKITVKNSRIQEVESHHIYINNARLFANKCTFNHIVGNGITCIDAIVEVVDSQFSQCKQSPYSIFWSDKSMGRIQNCAINDTERTFLAMTNQSLLELVNSTLSNVKTAAVVQEQSQLYIRGQMQAGRCQKDDSSRIIHIDLQQPTSKKTQRIVDKLSTCNGSNVED
ncbi:Right handed beta helix domain-containing protein OS=Lysinibacillus sphaericus OX=1421 GN=LS41612_10320 PE=4 SV=1 [Lysinibacillus sphaericus]